MKSRCSWLATVRSSGKWTKQHRSFTKLSLEVYSYGGSWNASTSSHVVSQQQPCLTSHTESNTPDPSVEAASVLQMIARQGAADDEASSRDATEPRRRRGVAPTARRGCLDR